MYPNWIARGNNYYGAWDVTLDSLLLSVSSIHTQHLLSSHTTTVMGASDGLEWTQKSSAARTNVPARSFRFAGSAEDFFSSSAAAINLIIITIVRDQQRTSDLVASGCLAPTCPRFIYFISLGNFTSPSPRGEEQKTRTSYSLPAINSIYSYMLCYVVPPSLLDLNRRLMEVPSCMGQIS